MKALIGFLGSYRVAIPLMLGLGAILALGTYYESSISTEVAGQLIYKTRWFVGLLGLLFLNVLLSTLKRWPFKKHHTGFVITHIGLLTLLAGSMISKLWGVEGELALQEGESATRFETKIESLSVAHGQSVQFVEKRFTNGVNRRPWKKSLHEGIEILVDGYWPNTTVRQFYEGGGIKKNPIILFKLSNAMTSVEEWLELKNPSKNSLDLGPAQIEFAELKSKKAVEELFLKNPEPSKNSATLKLTLPQKSLNHDYPIEQYLGKTTSIEGTDLTLKIKTFYTHAIVEEGKLVNKSDEWVNPAVEFEISGPNGNERHLAFSLYPEFDTLHGRGPQQYEFKSQLICDMNPKPGRNLLTVFLGPKNKLYYQLQSKNGSLRVGRLSLNDPFQTGWMAPPPDFGPEGLPDDHRGPPSVGKSGGGMGFEFIVKEFFPKAVVASEVMEAPPDPKMESNAPAIHVRLKDSHGALSDGVWIRRGLQKIFHALGHHFEIGYQYKHVPLGFKLTLVDFILGYYPGSNQPMNYESKVKLTDPGMNLDQEIRIYMNHPLTHRSYKFFQSSYVQGGSGERDISVFSINHDPGTVLIYGGSIVLVFGIYLLFFTRRFRKNSVAKIAASALCLLAALSMARPASAQDTLDYSQLEKVAIQNGGRVKPFQTFAHESIKFITGKERFEGKDAIENLLSFATDPERTIEHPMIRITFRPLMSDAGLDVQRKYFSLKELAHNEHLSHILEATIQKQTQNTELSPYEKKVASLYQQIQLLHQLLTGEAYTLLPNLKNADDRWLALTDVDQYEEKFASEFKETFRNLGLAFQKKNIPAFNEASLKFALLLRNLAPEAYPASSAIQREIFYNDLAPFQKAWMIYLATFVLSLAFTQRRWAFLYFIPFIAGFGFHSLGIILRIAISRRAPVSNMYESMIFLVWGICLFALILQAIHKTRIFSSVASFLGFLILLMAQSLPIDSSIAQLVPVLRSNFWLTIHVLTVMLSYSAFALAMGIGHFNLGLYLFRPQKAELFQRVSNLIFRTIQIGMILLVAGTILGGVWANESWGRFWGWDPKETWALISILGYLVIIHAKYAGWIGEFGLSVCSIAGFALILMTYYGVNFILAAGLHSYGFGSGGMPYVIGYIAFETLLIVLALMRRH